MKPENRTEEIAIINSLLLALSSIEDVTEDDLDDAQMSYNYAIREDIKEQFFDENTMPFMEAKLNLITRIHHLSQYIFNQVS